MCELSLQLQVRVCVCFKASGDEDVARVCLKCNSSACLMCDALQCVSVSH